MQPHTCTLTHSHTLSHTCSTMLSHPYTPIQRTEQAAQPLPAFTMTTLQAAPAATAAVSSPTSLFTLTLPLHVHAPGREKCIQTTTITVTSFLSAHNKSLHIEFNQEDDPYFLYASDVSETDYGQLKKDQQLMVDFGGFPEQLKALLSLCVPNGSNGSSAASTGTASTVLSSPSSHSYSLAATASPASLSKLTL